MKVSKLDFLYIDFFWRSVAAFSIFNLSLDVCKVAFVLVSFSITLKAKLVHFFQNVVPLGVYCR